MKKKELVDHIKEWDFYAENDSKDLSLRVVLDKMDEELGTLFTNNKYRCEEVARIHQYITTLSNNICILADEVKKLQCIAREVDGYKETIRLLGKGYEA